ncbi:tRNA (adenine(22)-N(1))-methyltransferase [Haploplasma axanthum]|nr:class I SAM-dependent methyltransferase [Haploplasma axanthum]
MIKNKRIDALVDETKGINTLLDIGCDHGLVIKKAFENKNIKKAIASDVNEMPLESAKKNLKGFDVEFIVSNGFENIKDKFDGVVIAGMGAMLISNILEKAPEGDITYILQANSKLEVLREYLSNNNFKIIDEIVVFEKFYYIIIRAVRGNEKLNEKELYLGPILMKKTSSISYYQNLLDRYYRLINLEGTNSDVILQRVKWLESIINKNNKGELK